MIDFDFNKECYSCSACKSVCPQNAISYDEELYALVNIQRCIECGLCESVCPRYKESEYLPVLHEVKSYICLNKDMEIRRASSSGGIFFLLAEHVLDQRGYVCGCVYDGEMMPVHIVSNQKDDVRRMMGSKYVTSMLGDSLIRIKEILKKGKPVLFSGVPCQVAAVKNYVGEQDNLYTVAVVCHGTIGRKEWRKYLIQEQEKRGRVTAVTMRDKTRGWLNYGLKLSFEDGSFRVEYRKEDGYFLRAFTNGLFERDRCLACKYKGTAILSDLLLGDAWGAEELFPEMADEWGLSAVICLTGKGYSLFQSISEQLILKAIGSEEIIKRNQRIVSPVSENCSRRQFQKEWQAAGNVQELCKRYGKETLLSRIFRKLNRL